MPTLISWLLQAIAYLPLRWLQGLGTLLGKLVYHLAPRFVARIDNNTKLYFNQQNDAAYHRFIKQVIAETAKGFLELSVAWRRSPAYITCLVRDCTGWDHVQRSLSAGHGILFLTPHLGNYDIAGRYLSYRLPCPLTAMYRPPKLAWLEPVMNAGRARHNGRTVPANTTGVRRLIKALKMGEAAIILPDHVPKGKDGVWVPFFGKPCYTMTLATKLARLEKVDVLLFVGERLPKGKGFAVHIEPLALAWSGDMVSDTANLTLAIEGLIRRYPAQYLWSYNRYKCPAGVAYPDSEA